MIFSVIFPLLFVVALGYLCSYRQFITQEQISGVSRFIFYISIPALLFSHMAEADLSQVVDIHVLLNFYVPVAIVYFSSVLLLLRFKNSLKDSAVLALGSNYSNTVLVGLPIIISAMGKQWLSQIFIVIAFHSLFLFSATIFLASIEGKQKFDVNAFLKTVLLNPVVLSISLGLLINLAGFSLPKDLNAGLTLLGEPGIGGALFILGASLCHLKVGENWKLALVLSTIKLILLPLLVLAFTEYVWLIPKEQQTLLVLLAASPAGVNAYLVACQLETMKDAVASTVVLSTILSLLSFTFWLMWLL
ncbi:MAG: AEC family transporter [Parashewanella sp.]